jgi:hypothetical protein
MFLTGIQVVGQTCQMQTNIAVGIGKLALVVVMAVVIHMVLHFATEVGMMMQLGLHFPCLVLPGKEGSTL